jgi:hypothetical protein
LGSQGRGEEGGGHGKGQGAPSAMLVPCNNQIP